jgi:hypothetical protein
MQAMDSPTSSKVAPETVDNANETRSVSRAWVIVGSLAVLIGMVMGYIMSSFGK